MNFVCFAINNINNYFVQLMHDWNQSLEKKRRCKPLLLEKPQQPISPSAPGLSHNNHSSSNLQKNQRKKTLIIHFQIEREKEMKKVKVETGNDVNEMDSISEPTKMNESPIESVFAVEAMIYGYDYVPSSSPFPGFPLQLRLRRHRKQRRKFHFSVVVFFIFHYRLHSQNHSP